MFVDTVAAIAVDDVVIVTVVERQGVDVVEAGGEATPCRVESFVVDNDERLHALPQHRHQRIVVKQLMTYRETM